MYVLRTTRLVSGQELGDTCRVVPEGSMSKATMSWMGAQTRVERRKKVQCDHTDPGLGKRVLCAQQGQASCPG